MALGIPTWDAISLCDCLVKLFRLAFRLPGPEFTTDKLVHWLGSLPGLCSFPMPKGLRLEGWRFQCLKSNSDPTATMLTDLGTQI